MLMNILLPNIINDLKNGKIGVMPTDTIYGIVGSALNKQTVEKIYKLRKRSNDKPFIILISSLKDLELFSIKLTNEQRIFLQRCWPSPLSVILQMESEEFKYLHRGRNSLAFRMPKDTKLIELLNQTGPLVAPSVNIEGEKFALNIEEAKRYFGNKISFYKDGGILESQPSTLIQLKKDGSFKILRKGSFKVE